MGEAEKESNQSTLIYKALNHSQRRLEALVYSNRQLLTEHRESTQSQLLCSITHTNSKCTRKGS